MHVSQDPIQVAAFAGFAQHAQRTQSTIQRTGVDKILAIRFGGGVGGANIKNMYTDYTPLAPQTRRTTEY